MKLLVKYGGLGLIFLGVLLFATLQLLHFTFVNAVTSIPLVIVIVGVSLHVWSMKRESRY